MIPLSMRRLTVATAVVLFASPIGFTQAVVSSTETESNESEVVVNQMVVYAAGQPDPMLRFRLWPEAGLRQKDNATPLVNRAVILLLQVPAETQKRFAEQFSTWNELSIDELPADEVRTLLNSYQSALRELKRAEYLMQIDYSLQLEQLTATELVETLLPELQEMRTLGRLIQLRARLAIKEQRWDDMIDDCRLGFRLAEVAGHSTDFLIGRLVGFAIANTMMEVIETAIQRPGCPNLYWALACLPSDRLFETREALEFESILISRIFSGVGRLPDQPIGPDASREKIREMVHQANQTLFAANVGRSPSESADLLAGAYVVMMADPSRDLLAETTQWGDRAYQLSAPEAVLRATILKFTRARDGWVAWSRLPAETWDLYAKEWEESLAFKPGESDPLVSLVGMLTPAVNAARNAGRRSEQLRNWLLTVEALRMHAAVKGELPASIDHLLPVPAWSDSIANRDFAYQRSGPNQAVLTRAARYPDDPQSTYRIQLKGME